MNQEDGFIGQVQHRAGLGSQAERGKGATLESLAERLARGEACDLAAQLPAAFAQIFNVANEGDLPEITSL
jgi:uncharacterized protein (DUF2267 family)